MLANHARAASYPTAEEAEAGGSKARSQHRTRVHEVQQYLYFTGSRGLENNAMLSKLTPLHSSLSKSFFWKEGQLFPEPLTPLPGCVAGRTFSDLLVLSHILSLTPAVVSLESIPCYTVFP